MTGFLDGVGIREHLTQRVGNEKLLADPDRGRVLDFFVPRHSAGSLGSGIVIDTVLSALPQQ